MRAEVQKERKVLVGVVLDNRKIILDLKQIEEEGRARGNDQTKEIEDRRELDTTDSEVAPQNRSSVLERQNAQSEKTVLWSAESSEDTVSWGRRQGKNSKQKERRNRKRRSPKASIDSSIRAPSASRSAHVIDSYEVSEPRSSVNRPSQFIGIVENQMSDQAHDLSRTLTSQERSASQSPVSEYYEMPPENPITDNTDTSPSDDNVDTNSPNLQRLDGKVQKRQGSPSDAEIVTPSAEWFLSVVPHESNVNALIVRPRPGQTNHLRARAEETAKKLLLTWTNVDPDAITGDDSGSWDDAEISYYRRRGTPRDAQIPNPPNLGPYAPQAYPTYVPQEWSRPSVYTLPPSTTTPYTLNAPPVETPPHPPTERQTDGEELARLKKLILDEKAEQDKREAEVSVAVPPAVPHVPTELEDSVQATKQREFAASEREGSVSEAVDALQVPQEHGTLWKAEHPRLQPVIMKDWLGRKFIFPVDMCQTWEVGNSKSHPLSYANLFGFS